MKSIFFTLISLSLLATSYGQDNIPLLYNQIPISINPSFAGSSDFYRVQTYFENTKVSNNKTVYSTQEINFDTRVYDTKSYKIGLGYRLDYDHAGEANFSKLGNYVSLACQGFSISRVSAAIKLLTWLIIAVNKIKKLRSIFLCVFMCKS